MALQPSSHPRVHASTHASHSHATSHAASKAKPVLAAEEGEGGGFAAQLLKAHPAAAQPKAADAAPKPKTEAKKPADDSSGKDTASKDADKDGKDATADPKALPPELTAVLPIVPAQPQPMAPATTSLADKTAADGKDDEFADPLGALRKAASAKGARPGADDGGKQALLASLGAGKQAAVPTAAGLPGKGAASTGDIAAALAKAEGAVKAATEARDSLAAMLPQADPVALQAGAIGAAANAPLDNSHAAHQALPMAPAQATLTMPPQSPTFAPALGQQIDVWMKGGVQHAEVQLSPQDLGPIRVKIEMQGDQTRVHMTADVQSTRDALQQAMPQLSEQLGTVGLSLSGSSVSDQPSFAQQQQAQANADGGFGGNGRQGNGGPAASGQGGLEDIAAATAARQMAQRRGLPDPSA